MGYGVFEHESLSSEGLLGLLAAAQRVLGLTTGSHPKCGCLCWTWTPGRAALTSLSKKTAGDELRDVCGPIPLLTGASPASAAGRWVGRQDSFPCTEIIPDMSETARKNLCDRRERQRGPWKFSPA